MSDLNGHEPFIMALESWRDAGVLDAPSRITTLEKSLRSEVDGLRKSLADQTGVLHMVMAFLKEKHLTLQLPDTMRLEMPAPQVTCNPAIQHGDNHTHVDMAAFGEVVAKALGDLFVPILKTLAERPIAEFHSVDKSVAQPVIEHVHHDAPQVTVPAADMAPVAKAIDGLGEVTKAMGKRQKALEGLAVETAKGLDVLTKSVARLAEALTPKEQPLPAPVKKTIKVVEERYDGSYAIREEEAPDDSDS